MKRKKIITVFLLLNIPFFTGCSDQPSQSVEVSLLYDVTPSNSSGIRELNSQTLGDLFGLDENPDKAVRYRQSIISGSWLNVTQEISLPPVESVLLSNEFARRDSIRAFKEQIALGLERIASDTLGRDYSSVYLPIARELTRLSQSPFDKRILVVLSDLAENEFLSFYDHKTADLLINDPEKIAELFQREMQLPESLSNITVYLVHQPSEGDLFFKHAAKLYVQLLASKNATIHVQANLLPQ